jgi:hypothetical protein
MGMNIVNVLKKRGNALDLYLAPPALDPEFVPRTTIASDLRLAMVVAGSGKSPAPFMALEEPVSPDLLGLMAMSHPLISLEQWSTAY